MDKNYKGLIWTDHAIERLRERGLKQGDAWATWNRPDQTRYASAQGAWIYYRTYGSIKIEVVAKQNEKKEWIIISVWSSNVSGGYVTLFIPIFIIVILLILLLIFPSKKPIIQPTVEPTDLGTSLESSAVMTQASTPTIKPTLAPTPKPSISPTTAPVINNIPPSSGYSRQSVSTDAGTFTVSIVSTDISFTKVVVDTASTADCTSNCPVMSLSDYVARNNGFAGINGTYFCPRDYPSCSGKENTFDLLVMNKDKYYFNSNNNVYSNNPAVIFGGGYIRFVSAGSQWGRDTGVNGVLMNYPLLVFNNNISFGGDDDPKKGSKGNRSFVANRGNTVYIGVVHSATVAESARVMKALGMENALNLDDGGSTALWFGGYKVGPGRLIPNAIIFKR